MRLNNQQLLNFVARIKLPREKEESCRGQVDTLKSNVRQAIKEMPGTKVIKVKTAGSWKKHTSLKPWGDNPVDVDIVFFVGVDAKVAPDFGAESLHNHIISVLRKAYPNKDAGDFHSGKKTVGLVFRGTGLEVDIVPFVPTPMNPEYGWQPQKKMHSGKPFLTSIDRQLGFIADVKGRWSSFVPAVRMVKWWCKRRELELPSFAVELLFAHLLWLGRVGGTIEDALITFFEFVSANPEMRVGFPCEVGVLPTGAPIVADPTNNENNVLEKVSADEWHDIINDARTAFETLSYAQQTESETQTDDLWREVFDQFNRQEG